MKRWLVASLIVLSVLLAGVGCYSANDSTRVGRTEIVAPVDYGNGVYYFHATRAQFANSLSDFIKNHKGLRFAGMTGDGGEGYGKDMGYFVVFYQE